MTKRTLSICIFAVVAVLFTLPGLAGAQRGGRARLRKYEARYHVIYTDLPRDKAYEAIARVNAMDEEYYKRTKGFGGKIRKKLPFYLYSRHKDYLASLDKKFANSAGVYTGKELKAVADEKLVGWGQVWRVVQHEGFHQFAHMVISRGKGTLPIWLNEGLAEYFGEAIWTGDNMVAGLIDPGATWRKGDKIFTRQGRLQRVQEEIKQGDFMSFAKMIAMTPGQWNAKLIKSNYDQVWSMVHFLVHAKDGKYRKRFQNYLGDVVKGKDSLGAFRKRFGNLRRLQKRYEKWWLGLGENPTAELYDKATVQTLTSFLARAYLRKIRFETAEEFFTLARKGELDIDAKRAKKLWLPPALLSQALQNAQRHKNWQIKPGRRRRPTLRLTRPDGMVLEGSFTLRGRKGIGAVTVKIKK